MKIYFATTVLGDRSNIEDARRLVELLEAKGHTVLTRHLVHDDAPTAEALLSIEEIFARDMRWLREADLVLVNATGSGFGVGFETGFALGALGKKVILVYHTEKADRVSRMARGLAHENATIFPYRNFDELATFIEERC